MECVCGIESVTALLAFGSSVYFGAFAPAALMSCRYLHSVHLKS